MTSFVAPFLRAFGDFVYSQRFVTPASPVQSFSGQTVIVTGGNNGLGKEAARHIARLGASKVIIAARNSKKGQEAREDILKTTGREEAAIEVWQLDLSSYDSVKAFAERTSSLERLDVLLANAGMQTSGYSTAEGHERTITVNVISTFLLALLLLPKLKESAKRFKIEPRLTIVSSELHAWVNPASFPKTDIFPTLDSEKLSLNRYMVSKLMEVLIVRELAPSLSESPVILNVLNPGLCYSGLSYQEGDDGVILKLAKAAFFIIAAARTTEVGSRTLVASAAAGRESHGKYMYDGLVGDEHLGSWVRSDEGTLVGRRAWEELSEILEKVSPGVTGNLNS
ncbi:short-chain dehydrogenase/reductase [Microstroma glucosiphilum]|uniref:Short-chain dehydrogenase/reductase n=1 Tax=Pseudomicrostroma glucosiphilum TaxID=1684307 RepID=A0A316U3M5_9BASI|nr:short-chain dehydrogenase/reductase [Pseudomicrostroma glucosiphilum]PWN19837.1 short-chain dehydrogenase/reductase [Pseudomicrostroma glucosiphilum]